MTDLNRKWYHVAACVVIATVLTISAAGMVYSLIRMLSHILGR